MFKRKVKEENKEFEKEEKIKKVKLNKIKPTKIEIAKKIVAIILLLSLSSATIAGIVDIIINIAK